MKFLIVANLVAVLLISASNSQLDEATGQAASISWLNHAECGLSSSSKLFGAEDFVGIGEFPWLVRVLTRFEENGEWRGCSGTLISSEWVLTSAYCVSSAILVRMKFGVSNLDSSSGPVKESSTYFTHPRFDRDSQSFDFALVRLADPFRQFSASIKPICLNDQSCDPSVNGSTRVVDSCSRAVIVGWGRTEDESRSATLLKQNILMSSRNTCNFLGASGQEKLCAESGACEGDWGGPIMCRQQMGKYVALGVLSHHDHECSADTPAYHGRVCSAMPWIKQVVTGGGRARENEATTRRTSMATTSTRRPSTTTQRRPGSTWAAPSPPVNTGSIFGALDCGISSNSIIGGEDARKRQFPWIASISSDYGNCGGALLSREWVLTAAHCIFQGGNTVQDVDIEFARYRIQDVNELGVKRKAAVVIKHPVFDNSRARNRAGNFSHDYALLRLDRPVTFTDFIKPICLPDGNRCSLEEDVARVDGCSTITVAGWGRVDRIDDSDISHWADVLQYTTLGVYKPSECRRKWGVGDANICAGFNTEQTTTCSGDSGGPAFCQHNGRQTVVGLVSFGTTDCGAANEHNPDGYPTAFARVCKILPWIQSIVQQYAY